MSWSIFCLRRKYLFTKHISSCRIGFGRRNKLASTTPSLNKRPRGARPLGGRLPSSNSQISEVRPTDYDDPQSGVDTVTSPEVAVREGDSMDQGAPSPTEIDTDYSVSLILGRREFKRPSKVDTKASVSASVISFGDPYDSPSSLSPSLPYVAESPVDPSPNITSPPGASRQLSRPPSDASLRHPPSIGAPHVPKSPLTHWARLRGAVLPGEPPLPVDAEQATGATTPARTAIHAPSIYSLSQQIQQKSSRLARFGKRQQSSASYTSQAAVTDIELAKRFAIDLRKACQSAKLSAAGIDDGTALPGAPAYSQKSPPSTSHVDEHQTFNNANNGVSSKIGLHRGSRRPPSSRSLAAQGTKQVFVPQAGPHQVLTVLEQYSAMPGVSNTLPGESEVLSTLFTPFLRHFASERHAENARVVALEAFDVITLHWRSANSEVSLYAA